MYKSDGMASKVMLGLDLEKRVSVEQLILNANLNIINTGNATNSTRKRLFDADPAFWVLPL